MPSRTRPRSSRPPLKVPIDSCSNSSSAKETSQWCHVFKKQFVRFCVQGYPGCQGLFMRRLQFRSSHIPAALDHRTREKISGAQCSLRVKNVTTRHRVVMVTKSSSTGSCLLWVMSTKISVDIAVDIAVDSRSIVGRQSVHSRSTVGR